MNCTTPPALTDLELAMVLGNDAEPAVHQHLLGCPACRERATRLAQQDATLRAQLYRSYCPTPDELRDYHLLLLDKAAHSNTGLHLARCPHCTRELFDLAAFLAPPDRVPTPLERVKLLVARLVDLGGDGLPALMGARGDEPTILLYQVDDLQIGLEVVEDPTSGRKRLDGMITAADLSNLLVHLWQGEQLVATAAVDELLGDFHFADLPADPSSGAYDLIVSAQQTKIRLPHLRLG